MAKKKKADNPVEWPKRKIPPELEPDYTPAVPPEPEVEPAMPPEEEPYTPPEEIPGKKTEI